MRSGVAVYAAALAAAAAIFLLFPGIDLWAAGLFYRPGAGFLGNWVCHESRAEAGMPTNPHPSHEHEGFTNPRREL